MDTTTSESDQQRAAESLAHSAVLQASILRAVESHPFAHPDAPLGARVTVCHALTEAAGLAMLLLIQSAPSTQRSCLTFLDHWRLLIATASDRPQ